MSKSIQKWIDILKENGYQARTGHSTWGYNNNSSKYYTWVIMHKDCPRLEKIVNEPSGPCCIWKGGGYGELVGIGETEREAWEYAVNSLCLLE